MMSAYSQRRRRRSLKTVVAGFSVAVLAGCASAPEPAATEPRATTKSTETTWRLFDTPLGARKDELNERLARTQRHWATCEIREPPGPAGQAPALEACVAPGLAEQPAWLSGVGQAIKRVRYVFVNERLRQIEAAFNAPSTDKQFQEAVHQLSAQFGQPVMQSSVEAIWQRDGQRAVLRRGGLALEALSGTL